MTQTLASFRSEDIKWGHRFQPLHRMGKGGMQLTNFNLKPQLKTHLVQVVYQQSSTIICQLHQQFQINQSRTLMTERSLSPHQLEQLMKKQPRESFQSVPDKNQHTLGQ